MPNSCVGSLRLQYRDRKDLGLEPQQSFAILIYKCYNLGYLVRCAQEIGLVQHDEHLFAPGANTFQELPFAFSKRAVRRGDK